MPSPMCVECGLTMKCDEISKPVLVMSDKEKTEPYEFCMTDVYRCPGCDTRVIAGFGKATERHEESFDRMVKAAGGRLLKVF